MSLLPSPLIPLLIFSVPNPTNRLRMHPKRLRYSYDVQERIRIDLESVTMCKNALRTGYELATDFFHREFVAEILNSSKLCPRSPD